MLTEEEAKTKWCPFVRLAMGRKTEEGVGAFAGRVPTFNRIGDDSGQFTAICMGSNCIASQCMAWRWEDEIKPYGRCGLAGKP